MSSLKREKYILIPAPELRFALSDRAPDRDVIGGIAFFIDCLHRATAIPSGFETRPLAFHTPKGHLTESKPAFTRNIFRRGLVNTQKC